MRDKIRIIYGALGAFSTARFGFLRVMNGEVKIDWPRAFNMSAAMQNEGANCIHIFLRNTYGVEREYDWRTPGYWDLLRKFVILLHQPYQDGVGPGDGAEILIDLFDNCNADDKALMNDPARYEEGRQRARDAFAALGDLPFVKFKAGNEMESGYQLAFFKGVIIPAFTAAGRIPYSYGACYATTTPAWNGPVEQQKKAAEDAWGEPAALAITRIVHGIVFSGTDDLIEVTNYWVRGNNPILIELSNDGARGSNPCDWTMYQGQKQARPSEAEFESAVDYLLSAAPRLTANGEPKYGFEHCGKKEDDDDNDCIPRMIGAIARACERRTGEKPFNAGKYPLRWIEYVDVPVCPTSELLRNDNCPPAIVKKYVKGQEPTAICAVHKKKKCSCWGWLWRGDFKRLWDCLFGDGQKWCK
jgi:hypothetical protein